MDPTTLKHWQDLPATKQVIEKIESMAFDVIPNPDPGFSPGYGNYAFGHAKGFHAACQLFRSACEIDPEAKLEDHIDPDWGIPDPAEKTPTTTEEL